MLLDLPSAPPGPSTRALRWTPLGLLVFACTAIGPPAGNDVAPQREARAGTTPKPETPPSRPPTLPAVASGDAPHACTSDADCVASCSQGAVSRSFYRKMFPGGEACEDGCTSKGTEAPRCQDGTCVAYRLGASDPLCTRRQALRSAPELPGPAHRCQRDAECRLSCAFGAIRDDWYGWQNLAARECRDGCASKGISARCEDGICAAYRAGERLRDCELRSIHE